MDFSFYILSVKQKVARGSRSSLKFASQSISVDYDTENSQSSCDKYPELQLEEASQEKCKCEETLS